MVVLEGTGGPRGSSRAQGIDPGLAFGFDLALGRLDGDAATVAWKVRAALRDGGASSNSPNHLDATATWAVAWRDGLRHRLAILNAGIGTCPDPWGPGGLYLPTTIDPVSLDLWAEYLQTVEALGPGSDLIDAVGYAARIDDLLLMRGVTDPAEHARLLEQLLDGGIAADTARLYDRSAFSLALRTVDDLDLGAAFGILTLPADLATVAEGPGETIDEHVEWGVTTVSAAATTLEVAGLASTTLMTIPALSSSPTLLAIAGAAASPAGVALITGAAIIGAGYLIYDNWDTITETGAKAVEAVSDAAEHLADGVEAAGDWVVRETTQLAQDLQTGTDQLVANLNVRLEDVGEDVSAWVSDTEETLRGAAAELDAELDQLLDRGRDELDHVVDVAHGLVERGDHLARSIGDTLTFWEPAR